MTIDLGVSDGHQSNSVLVDGVGDMVQTDMSGHNNGTKCEN